MKFPRPLVLIILDGWGIAAEGKGNAVTLAKIPFMKNAYSAYPHTLLSASGEAVGLPKREVGNSETGHLNLGAGKIVFQDLPKIDMAIADGSFFRNNTLLSVARHVQNRKSRLHLLGLIGSGGVHSSISHLIALLKFAKDQKIKEVYLHLFTDGRDSPPTSAETYLNKVESELKNLGLGEIATLCGRYFAMDRDYHWDRTEKAYNLLTSGDGFSAKTVKEAISHSYENRKTDEFLEPTILDREGLIQNRDGIIFLNFRIDRPRQLTKAFVFPNFESLKSVKAAFDPYAEKYGLKQYQKVEQTSTFRRKKILTDLFFVTMTEYEKGLPVETVFPPEVISYPIARVLAEKNLRQFHIAETEKERFVTYYFDGQRERPFPGEDWAEIESPNVPTYDKKPEMSAEEVTKELIKRIRSSLYDFILVNFANPDMVGHTGVIPAAIRACEKIDNCLSLIHQVVIGVGGSLIITADHGNVEEMINPHTGGVDTEHSANPVPFIVIDPRFKPNGQVLGRGILADVAPTILRLMDMKKPEAMAGRNLFEFS